MDTKKFSKVKKILVAATFSILLSSCGKSDGKNDFVPIDAQEQQPTDIPQQLPTEVPQIAIEIATPLPIGASKTNQDVELSVLRNQQKLTENTLLFLLYGVILFTSVFLIRKSRWAYLFILMLHPLPIFIYCMANINNIPSVLVNTIIICVAAFLGYRQTK